MTTYIKTNLRKSHVTSTWHSTSWYDMTTWRNMTCHVVSCNVVSCHIAPHHVTLRHARHIRNVMIQRVTLHDYVMWRDVRHDVVWPCDVKRVGWHCVMWNDTTRRDMMRQSWHDGFGWSDITRCDATRRDVTWRGMMRSYDTWHMTRHKRDATWSSAWRAVTRRDSNLHDTTWHDTKNIFPIN